MSGEGDLVAVLLAAGAGTRLRPLTDLVPKALCPVDNEPLAGRALAAIRKVPDVVDVAINAHALAAQVVAFAAEEKIHVEVEEPVALGTAGAIGNLRDWIAGRAVLVHNADAWHAADLAATLVDGWDGERMRLLVVDGGAKGDFGRWRYAGACLLPWTVVQGLRPEPTGLYEVAWRGAEVRGSLDFARYDGPWFDCGTPQTYLAANLAASGGESVIGPGAVVHGEAIRSVVWPNSVVRPGERLVECIRVGTDLTVRARQP